MNSSIQKLHSIANKNERLIIGLMSGTSMDGLDIALCRCKNHGSQTQVELLNFITMPYQDDFREDVKSIFSRRDADLQKVCLLNEMIGITHAALIVEALKQWHIAPTDVDVIASHGQTIFHAPRSLHQLEKYPNATLQIGDADHIAVKTGIITIADFRQKHLAAGGEGAPLAVYGDYLVFSKLGEDRIMLNIGGISNFTFLPGDLNATQVFSIDIGPGNTIMDHFVQEKYPGQYYDKDAALARSGNVNHELLHVLLDNEFFKLAFPKTTGPELFSLSYLKKCQQISKTTDLGNADVLATLCHFTAKTITDAINKVLKLTAKPVLFMSGGGMHNPLLVDLMKQALPSLTFLTTQDLEINPDAKEAVLFALLANEALAGSPINFGEREGVPSVCMGKISFPS